MMKNFWLRFVEWLYLRACQTNHVTGTDPDDGGHMTLRIGWNSPTDAGGNRPIFCVIMQHSQRSVRARMLLSPEQMAKFVGFTGNAVKSQMKEFGHTEPLDYDTRYLRARDED